MARARKAKEQFDRLRPVLGVVAIASVGPALTPPPVTGSGPLIALVDSMIDVTHPEFASGNVATTGGLAPALSDCNAATAGAQVEVPYTADYYFWKETGR